MLKTARSANIHVQSPQNLQKCASYFFIVTLSDILPSETISARLVKQKWFGKISSPHIIRICLGVLRTLFFYINFRQLAINGHQCCVLAHASPLSVLKHALGRKWSLMATPSKRDGVNAQSSFKFRSVDSQTISF